MTLFSTWEADRSGVFQGTPTPGEVLDAFLKRLGKPLVIKSIAEHWSRWEEGEAIEFDDTEFAEWRAACRLFVQHSSAVGGRQNRGHGEATGAQRYARCH